MRSDKEPRTFYAFWLSLLGFVLGLLIVLIATGLAVYLRNLAISLDSVVQLHLTDQIFWVIDAVPFLAAVTLGIAGGRLNFGFFPFQSHIKILRKKGETNG